MNEKTWSAVESFFDGTLHYQLENPQPLPVAVRPFPAVSVNVQLPSTAVAVRV